MTSREKGLCGGFPNLHHEEMSGISRFAYRLTYAAFVASILWTPAAAQNSAAQSSSAPAVWSSADSLVVLLNTPETFDVLRKHIPFFVNLTEHGLIPAFSTEMTLDDLLDAPGAQVTAEKIAAINTDLARLPARLR